MSTTDDWLYSDDLDVNITGRDRLDSTDSRVLDGDDLLDDVLIAPPTAPPSGQTPTNDDELLGMGVVQEEETLEGSASARLNAEVMARTIQSRIESSKTSQGVSGSGGSTLYSREPNRKNSFFIGNLTWWTTDLDVITAVQESNLGDVTCIKFYENRANGQSKGYALVELANEALAISAADKLQTLTIHSQSPLVMYAAKISPHQFETKCNTVKSGGSISHSSSATSISSSSSSASIKPKPQVPPALGTSLPMAPPIRPPTATSGVPGFPPPPIPGFRPPGLPGDISSAGLGLMGPPPPLPPPGLPNLPPGIIPGLGNPLIRPSLPGMSNLPPGMMGDHFKNIGVAPHLNPAFLQEMAAQGGMAAGQKNIQNMAELFARFRNQAAVALGGAGGVASPSNGAKQPTEEEAADANQRNRAISSSAISRAMSDANSGDYEGAIDTLKMAITLIKQSVTSGTEASQILIQSLQDCLHSIEDQSTVTKRSSSSSRREHRSHDDRDRSRSGHRSSKHHRDRSRERRR